MPKPTRPAVYARISADAEARGLGVERQRRDCGELLKRKRWPKAVDLYCDNDISATRKNGKLTLRPQWRRLLDDIEARNVDAVVAWELDRLCRDPLEQEQFFLTCEQAGVHYICTYSDDVDIASGEGLMVARIKGAVNAEEARRTRKRVTRKKLEIAEGGRPHGGPRAFGFASDGATIVKREAAMIREASRRVLAGEAVYAIARDWNAKGKRTAHGMEWRGQTLRDILRSPRIAGLRQYRGKVLNDAGWPAILPREEWERVCRAVFSPGKSSGRPPRRLLSGGVLRCGKCQSPLSSAAITGARRYRCKPGPGLPGCGGVTIVAEPLEELVVEAVRLQLRRNLPAAQSNRATKGQRSEGGRRRASLVRDIADAERRLEDLAVMWGNGELSTGEWTAARRTVEARRDSAQRRLREHEGDERPVANIPPDLDAVWDSLDLERQRAVIATVIDAIIVSPARHVGQRELDESRLDVRWRV